MQKRFRITILALAASLSLFVGCGKAADDDSSEPGNNNVNQSADYSHAFEDNEKSVENDIESTEDGIDADDDSAKDSNGSDDDSVQDNNDSDDASVSTQDGTESAEDGRNSTNNNAVANNSNGTAASGTNNGAADRDAYMNDLQEILDMNNSMEKAVNTDDTDQMVTELKKLINGLDMKTPEGIAIKSDLQSLITLMEDMLSSMDNLDMENADMDAYNAAMNEYLAAMDRLTEIEEDMEKHTTAFIEAAEKAGVTESDLASFDIMF